MTEEEFDEIEGEEKTESEKFNMATQILRRVDYLLNCITECMIEQNLPQWFNYLIALKNLNSYKFTEDERFDNNAFEQLINEQLPEFYEKMYYNSTLKRFYKKQHYDYDISPLINYLKMYQDFLLKFLDKRGMLSAKKGDSDLF